MHVWRSLDDVPRLPGPAVVTVGNFDGVHRGHAAVLRQVTDLARARQARAVAITFEPHPLHVLRPDVAPPLVTGPDQRVELLALTGLDALLVQRFDLALAGQSPQEWVAGTVVGALGATTVVIGTDVRFGHKNAGDLGTLRELGERYGFDVVALSDVEAPQGRRWSSSWVRSCLAVGDVGEAARVLGRPHRLDATVVHGDHRGRELGYPTANLGPDLEGLVPADGVYAGRLRVVGEGGGAAWPAAVSIGTNPQFDGTERRVEAHVLPCDDLGPDDLDLYGRRVRVELVERLRDTLRFDDVDALLTQMARDVEEARVVLGAPAPRAQQPLAD
ncbi:bifunctional riboflavin kinase/FAD synthetase [Aquipuribacter sp. MA13-6]|uniref:bifunctional riboflavin kinase/FAD synthetase n=1 Tax=unclassified Aquipuribacter TaxID=2635084 RepID=UPI003EEA39E2